MLNIILCGGSGTRLWPLSRQAYPKQFVKFIDKHSLFQETVLRNASIFNKFCIVTNREHYFIAEKQMYEVGAQGNNLFILEPFGKNTAPAICFACLACDPEEIVLVTPSDHLIQNAKVYEEKVRMAVETARTGRLVTFGIYPAYPETGYGYIEAGDSIDKDVYCVKSFKEKPDAKTAEYYIKSGNFWWNSGMFAFKAGVYLQELKEYSPDIYNSSVKVFENSKKETDVTSKLWLDEKYMAAVPSDSIDYAVMEKSNNVCVVTAEMGWNDLGSFDALYDVVDKDSCGNSKTESVVYMYAKNNLVLPDYRKIALIGVEDCIVVDTDDALLVARRGISQNVKDVVKFFQEKGKDENEITVFHTTVHRPWGTYTILEEKENYKVKEITVFPGKRLSLQKHAHRSEYWVVVKGEAIIQVGDVEYNKKPGESIFIPAGEKHRLTNKGDVPVVIIETQTGAYLGEDDIVRLEDDFNRV